MLLEIYQKTTMKRAKIRSSQATASAMEGLTKVIIGLNKTLIIEDNQIMTTTLDTLKSSVNQDPMKFYINEIQDESSKLNINTMNYALPYVLAKTLNKNSSDTYITTLVEILGNAQNMEKSITRDRTEYYYIPDILFSY